MTDQFSFNNIDNLLLQFALQTRELAQKKNQINEQIKVCRADIAERRSYIETIRSNTNKLEEEIRLKQSNMMHNKANGKSMKATNSLLLQYEQTLKEELESRKASYNHDKEVYEERIESYKKIFQLHEEYYCQNPLAQKLLMLQAEKEEIESRIKACDDQITMKQKELDNLTGPAVNPSTEKLPDSVSGQQPPAKPEKQLDPLTVESSDSSIDISSLHLNQTEISQNGQKTSVDAKAEEIHEENKGQDTNTTDSPVPEEASAELWSSQQVNEQSCQDATEEQDLETGPEDQVLEEQQSTVSDMEQTVEQEDLEERVAVEEEQAPSKEDNEGPAASPQPSSQEMNPESSPATEKAVPSTPTFPFNFGPGSSPHAGSSDTKSPAFSFCLNSDPNTPGFSEFGFDVGLSRDEDSSFAFTGSFFNEKKTTESKSSSSEFLFGQPEQSEDFQFAFNSKSPQAANKDNTRDDFPFSFNF